MSHTKLLVHIIFRTKNSLMAIDNNKADDLYRYIWGIIKERKCQLIRINGMPDHIHIFLQYPPDLPLSGLVRDIKANSSSWIRKSGLFPLFQGWASEYAAFSYSARDQDMIVNYIKRQREHHAEFSFKDELQKLYAEFELQHKLEFFLVD